MGNNVGKIICKDGTEFNSYEEYLHSPEWDNVRTARLKIDEFKCRYCGASKNLVVHHITYDRIGNENPYNDLVTLCNNCHKAVHTSYENQMTKFTPMHWRYYKLDDTIEFIKAYIGRDLYMGGDVNMCDRKTVRKLSNEFITDKYDSPRPIDAKAEAYISDDDVIEFFKLMRYTLLWNTVFEDGDSIGSLLDKCGLKNQTRTAAQAFYKKQSENETKLKVLIDTGYKWTMDFAVECGWINPFTNNIKEDNINA